MEVKSLYYYPVKSCAGIQFKSARISERGILNDRIFMVINEDNVFMTQRENHKMALIKPMFSGDVLSLSAPGMPDILITVSGLGDTVNVIVWKDICEAVDQGNGVSKWLSSYLGTPARLVMMAPSFQRKLDPDFAISKKDQTGFADGYPFLLISQNSLDDLNGRLDRAIPINRFRPNIVVEGCTPYEEDGWRRIKIGDVVFEIVKPCVRCVITTIDQKTLETAKEPLATLATYRVSPKGGVMFGQNMIHHNNGQINVGDFVDIIE